MTTEEVEAKYKEINEVTREWRQGDCCIGDFEFLFVPNCSHHIASDDKLDNEDVYIQNVEGLCVISQTCDIVRCCKKRPYLEVSPLVKIDESKVNDVVKGRRPRYSALPALEDNRLVVDLDRVMTVEKSYLKNVERIEGCSNDMDRRFLARALSRKRQRFAFPNEFNKLASKLRDRLIEKHEKKSLEGEALRSLREIRITASPSWYEDEVDLFFYFIRNSDQTTFNGEDWEKMRKKWMDLLPESEQFKNINSEVTTLDIMSAKEYVESDQMDLDHLSGL